jgi:hypothetical protein
MAEHSLIANNILSQINNKLLGGVDNFTNKYSDLKEKNDSIRQSPLYSFYNRDAVKSAYAKYKNKASDYLRKKINRYNSKIQSHLDTQLGLEKTEPANYDTGNTLKSTLTAHLRNAANKYKDIAKSKSKDYFKRKLSEYNTRAEKHLDGLINKHLNNQPDEKINEEYKTLVGAGMSSLLKKHIKKIAAKASTKYKEKAKKYLKKKLSELGDKAKDHLTKTIDKHLSSNDINSGVEDASHNGGLLSYYMDGGRKKSKNKKRKSSKKKRKSSKKKRKSSKKQMKEDEEEEEADVEAEEAEGEAEEVEGEEEEESSGGYNMLGGTDTSTELNYSNQLSDEELQNLKKDYNEIINNIQSLDNSLKNLINSVNSSNQKESNYVFKDLIIKRRILMESIKDLEMKYNSIKSDKHERLDNAIGLIRKDKLIREAGKEKGLQFTMDDNVKQVFNTNMQLKGASDSLGDLTKLLQSKLHVQNGGSKKNVI